MGLLASRSMLRRRSHKLHLHLPVLKVRPRFDRRLKEEISFCSVAAKTQRQGSLGGSTISGDAASIPVMEAAGSIAAEVRLHRGLGWRMAPLGHIVTCKYGVGSFFSSLLGPGQCCGSGTNASLLLVGCLVWPASNFRHLPPIHLLPRPQLASALLPLVGSSGPCLGSNRPG